jgi:heme-degrading monooxygenase HmoA
MMVRIREGLFVQIQSFELSNDNSSKLVAKIQDHIASWISKSEGFVSANLHLSEDGRKVVNYLQWRSSDDYKNFKADEMHSKLKDEINAFDIYQFEDDTFKLVKQQSIEDEFWSKSRI